jgi:hypothetical protein
LLYRGVGESLPSGIVVDLAAGNDTVLIRWFRDGKRDSLSREWTTDVDTTLEGPAAAAIVAARLRERYGAEVEVIEDAVYPFEDHGVEYNRTARFSGHPTGTLTGSWIWKRRGPLVGGWVMPSLRAAPSDLEGYESKTVLRLPFDGEWMVQHGGRKAHENYHVQLPPLRFATDFNVTERGASFRTDGRTNADHFCFGRPILAPAAGRVALARDSFPENTPGRSPPGYRGPGNVVVIDHGNGEYSVLAHLRRGSVAVRAGEEVAAGAKVGECGNNGQSLWPHLHYQLQLAPIPGQRSVPAAFAHYRADGVVVERGEPRRGQVVAVLSR